MKYSKPDPTNQLIFPRLHSKDRAREYNESKSVKIPTSTKYLYKVPPNVALQLSKRRRELQISDDVLKNLMERDKELKKKMDVEWANLRDKEIELRNNIIYYDNFVTENREKRIRALKKINEEKGIYQQRSNDMEELQEKMNMIQYFKARFDEQLKAYKIYEYFLDSVVQLSNRDFKDVNAVMVRYDVLKYTRNSILNSQEAQVQELCKFKQNMTEILSIKMTEMLRLSVKASDLQTRWGRAKSLALLWENVLNSIKEKVIEQHSTVEGVKHAVDNLYTTLCARRLIDPDPLATPEQKMYYIKIALYNLQQVLINAPKVISPSKKKLICVKNPV